jgi:hypothetical protein
VTLRQRCGGAERVTRVKATRSELPEAELERVDACALPKLRMAPRRVASPPTSAEGNASSSTAREAVATRRAGGPPPFRHDEAHEQPETANQKAARHVRGVVDAAKGPLSRRRPQTARGAEAVRGQHYRRESRRPPATRSRGRSVTRASVSRPHHEDRFGAASGFLERRDLARHHPALRHAVVEWDGQQIENVDAHACGADSRAARRRVIGVIAKAAGEPRI